METVKEEPDGEAGRWSWSGPSPTDCDWLDAPPPPPPPLLAVLHVHLLYIQHTHLTHVKTNLLINAPTMRASLSVGSVSSLDALNLSERESNLNRDRFGDIQLHILMLY